jgi:hypothetical protein
MSPRNNRERAGPMDLTFVVFAQPRSASCEVDK